ncbi:recombinase family protein [Paenibacillus thermotolerans]|uniref:recombinase family protein n=1 Tax=Paenibacillus thermotolerans TaxID=3027807 RepID=UPI0023674626|nr:MULTISPECIES: recombinase family protein [unclassified Paenibacillus]
MFQLPDGEYAAYLRKSRLDLEREARGEEDTYKTHTRVLMELSKRYGVTITEIYREKPATSGERISERPEMIRLLGDVEDERWTGILVVEVERLARGDTMDQGIVAQAFKYSNTLIVTPMRIYDPTNPDDEEYFEFGLFMSRREFKTITRRLQGGRISGIKDGRFVGNRPPYGYVRTKLPGKGFTLEPHPEQSPIVQLIFSLYTDPDPKSRLGTALIARYLNDRKIPTQRNSKWIVATVNGVLRNPVYAGYVRWGYRPTVKRKNSKSRPRKSDEHIVIEKGRHPPLIDDITFKRAQNIMQENSHPPAPKGKVSNPLAGLIRCDMCGSPMQYRPYKRTPRPSLICQTQGCPNVSSYFDIVEEKLLEGLQVWLQSYRDQWGARRQHEEENDQTKLNVHQEVLKSLRKKLDELNQQKDEIHVLLEKKVYTIEVFLERQQKIAHSMEEVKAAIAVTEKELDTEQKRITAKVDTIPQLEHVLKVYPDTDVPAEKNALLKSVLEGATYRKEKGGRWSGAEDKFTLMLQPRLPK